jgi:hypothetical protein
LQKRLTVIFIQPIYFWHNFFPKTFFPLCVFLFLRPNKPYDDYDLLFCLVFVFPEEFSLIHCCESSITVLTAAVAAAFAAVHFSVRERRMGTKPFLHDYFLSLPISRSIPSPLVTEVDGK